MDTCTLKGRPPYPFEKIGVLLTGSSRVQELLAEAGNLSRIFGAHLLLIHFGKQTLQPNTTLAETYRRSGINLEETTIFRFEGEPVKGLLAICKENSVDLLILETIRREKALRYYLGSVTRGMSRSAKCSLLLLTEPQTEGTTFKKLVVSGVSHPKTPHTVNTAVYFAKHTGALDVAIVKELDQPALSMAEAYTNATDNSTVFKKQIANDEIRKMHNIISQCPSDQVKITEEIIFGRQGYTIRLYARNCNADLLVINSPDAKYGIIDRIFTHDMEYILEDLPCNVLIVHSRTS